MRSAGATLRRRPWLPWNDLRGGLTGGLAALGTHLPIGIIALTPLGTAASSAGVLAVLFASAVGGMVFAPLTRTRGLQCGASTAYALIVAAAIASLMGNGLLQPGPMGIPAALVLTGLLTVLIAACEACLTLSGVGRLVPLIPYPVLSGIRNSAALLMILVQIRQLVGLSAGLHWDHPGALLAGLTTALCVMFPIGRLGAMPPVVVGMLAGSAVHYLLAALTGLGFVGPVLAAPPSGVDQLRSLATGWQQLWSIPLRTVLQQLFTPALSIALLSLMDTLAAAAVVQERTGEHGSARGDLFALCASNVAAGAVGGLSLTGSVSVSLFVWDGGGRTSAAGMVRSLVVLAAALLLSPAIGMLPEAVVAGIVVGSGLRIADLEPFALARKVVRGEVRHRVEMVSNLMVMLGVPAAALTAGMVPAVFLGTLLSIVLFVVTMSGGVVRRRYRSPLGLSRTRRSEEETELMLAHGGEIEVIELHGALFFGSADQVAREMLAALRGGVRYLILDFKRVSRVDLSGARRLVQVASRLWREGAYLTFASVHASQPIADYFEDSGLLGQLRPDRVFTTLEHAVEHAEDALLAAHGAQPAARFPEEALRGVGLPEAAIPALLARMGLHEFSAGTRIITAGDESDVIYVLLKGKAEILLPVKAGEARLRLATVNAGTLFGEMALLSGAPRSADVVAVGPVQCLSLSKDTIAALRETQPDLAYHVMVAIAAQGVRNLRVANVALSNYEN